MKRNEKETTTKISYSNRMPFSGKPLSHSLQEFSHTENQPASQPAFRPLRKAAYLCRPEATVSTTPKLESRSLPQLGIELLRELVTVTKSY